MNGFKRMTERKPQRMTESTFDMVVLGAGTGGYAAALRGAALGMSVALVERDLVGGTCLHRGCIPTKALLHAAEIMDTLREGRERWGIQATVTAVDYTATAAARDDVVQKSFRGLETHLRKDGVEIVRGSGRLVDQHAVEVEGVGTLTARRGIVVATGSVPRSLPGLEPDGTHIITSDHALSRTTIPTSVIVLGAGAVGAEFASMYRSLGAEVTLVEALDRLLPLEDADLGKELSRAFRRRGITSMVNSRLQSAVVEDNQVTVTISSGEQTIERRAEVLLVAVGRAPVTQGLNLEDVGVHLDRAYVLPADWETLETHASGIYAVGDVLPPPALALAHASFAEGMLVAERIAGRTPAPLDYASIPRVTFSSPEVASVGVTEEQARAQHGEGIVVNRYPFSAVAKGLIHGQGGLVKVVAQKDGPVLGVHLIGARVTDLISEAMLITSWEALPSDVAQLIHPHPTLAEALGEAHLTLAGRGLHQLA